MTAPPVSDAFVQLIMNRAQAEKVAGRYSDLRPVGDGRPGHFAMIFEALDERSRRDVILKFLHPQHNQGYGAECFKREAKVGKLLLGKDNLVQLTGSYDTHTIVVQDQVTGAQLSLAFPYIALERARGTLSQLMFSPRKPRSLHRRLSAVRDVVRGVNRLHLAGYCHRDLKPDNCLIFPGGIVKVSDYGTCRLLSGEQPLAPDYLYPVGDLRYAPPEMFCGGGNRCELYAGADWFSVGAILFETVTNQNLYVAIGLRNSHEILSAFHVAGDVDTLSKQVSSIAGHYPIPWTLDYVGQPWLARASLPTHEAVTALIRDLCHFDWNRRLTVFERVLGRLDACILRAALDLGVGRWVRRSRS